MSIDRSHRLGVDRAAEGAGLESGALEFIEFAVDGREYLLVNYRDWRREQLAGAASRLSRHPVAGRIIFNGERHVVIERLPQSSDGTLSGLELVDILTQRELQVALLVSKGKCDKEIARTLGISGYTVREHLRRTFAKLKVSRRAAIVTYVLQHLREPFELVAARDP